MKFKELRQLMHASLWKIDFAANTDGCGTITFAGDAVYGGDSWFGITGHSNGTTEDKLKGQITVTRHTLGVDSIFGSGAETLIVNIESQNNITTNASGDLSFDIVGHVKSINGVDVPIPNDYPALTSTLTLLEMFGKSTTNESA